MTKITDNVDTVVKELLEGNIAGLPTETVYGLGANALNEDAVLKIYETKERPKFNPLIVHVNDVSDFEKYSENISDDVFKLAEKFSPGPITFVLKKKNIIPDITTAGNDSVGLRIPSHKLFREVIKEAGIPIAAPSANRAGKISPTSAEDVLTELGGKINYILDGGKCSVGIESTVISSLDEDFKILRHGSVSKEEIEKVIGRTVFESTGKLISPGMLKSHYAPSTPLYIVNDLNVSGNYRGLKVGILDFSEYRDLNEIALNLFSDLRKFDGMDFDIIICKKVTDEGIGLAINDRLERAAAGELKDISEIDFIEKRMSQTIK